jgi:hypothetical protein
VEVAVDADKITLFLSNIKNITNNKTITDYILEPSDYDFYKNIKKFEFSNSINKGDGELKIHDKIKSYDKSILDNYITEFKENVNSNIIKKLKQILNEDYKNIEIRQDRYYNQIREIKLMINSKKRNSD